MNEEKMDRAERRRIKKGLTKGKSYVRRNGIDLPPEPRSVSALSLSISDDLKAARKGKKNSLGAEIAAQNFEITIDNNRPTFELACKEGCSFCCHIFTSLSAPEVFQIAEYVNSTCSEAEIEAIIERCSSLVGNDVDSRFGKKIPCPLLKDDRCSVYPVRPIACRQCATNSAVGCKEAYNGVDADVGYSAAHTYAGMGVKTALHAALKASGYGTNVYELGEALAIALKETDAKERWVHGENIFSECLQDSTKSPDQDERINLVVDVIK